MSTKFTQGTSEAMLRALITSFNELHLATVAVTTTSGSFSKVGTGTGGVAYTTASFFHRDITGVPSGDYLFPSSSNLQCRLTASNGNLVSTIVSANELAGVIKAHFLDDSAHSRGDSVQHAYLTAFTASTNLASAGTLLSASYLAWNNHLASASLHLNTDATNPMTGSITSGITTQGHADFIVGQMFTKVNTHVASGPAVGRIKIV